MDCNTSNLLLYIKILHWPACRWGGVLKRRGFKRGMAGLGGLGLDVSCAHDKPPKPSTLHSEVGLGLGFIPNLGAKRLVFIGPFTLHAEEKDVLKLYCGMISKLSKDLTRRWWVSSDLNREKSLFIGKPSSLETGHESPKPTQWV